LTPATDETLMVQALDLWQRSGGKFDTVYPLFPGMTPTSVRRKVYGFRDRLAREADPRYLPPAAVPIIEGALDQLETIDEEAVWRRAVELSRKRLAARTREGRLVFDYGAVGLAFLADLHLGGEGVDYERIDREIDHILATPGLYIVAVGDLLDNFIVGKLLSLRVDQTPFRISEEWALVRRVLRRIAPRLVASVAGNHDNWTGLLAGVDYFREVTEQIVGRHILYHPHELRFTVQVGEAAVPFKARHKWRGASIYNPTHATEREAKFDGSYYWRVGVAAHTHASGVVREFNNRGQTALSCLCGSYKVDDDYAVASGFPAPNGATAVVVVVDEDGDFWGTSNLRAAAKYLSAVHR
jgi:hypothetical protein